MGPANTVTLKDGSHLRLIITILLNRRVRIGHQTMFMP